MAESPGPPSVTKIVPSDGFDAPVCLKSTYLISIFAPLGCERSSGTLTLPQRPSAEKSHLAAGAAVAGAAQHASASVATARRDRAVDMSASLRAWMVDAPTIRGRP